MPFLRGLAGLRTVRTRWLPGAKAARYRVWVPASASPALAESDDRLGADAQHPVRAHTLSGQRSRDNLAILVR
jgi:hypothetical protein